jgi:hypothetical protein
MKIIEILNDSAAATAKDLERYNPQFSKVNNANDPSEANLAIHFASEFGKKGFSIYSQANFKNKNNKRADVVAVNEKLLVVCEFKKLYDGAQAQTLLKDIIRARSFRLMPQNISGRIPSNLKPTIVFGIIAGVGDCEYLLGESTSTKKLGFIKMREMIISQGWQLTAPHGIIVKAGRKSWETCILAGVKVAV